MKHLLFFINLVLAVDNFAQFPKLSETAEVSIITVGPGANFYDCFGHSAFRISDQPLGLDRVYNYGTYDFSEPGFYTKFSMGIARYKLSAYNFNHFYDNYVRENRWITGQVLNLTLEEKQAVFDALETNHLPRNQFYLYDPFFDNCATKMRDIAKEVLGRAITFNNTHLKSRSSIRDLVNENSFNHPWWKLGIDLCLGNIVDRVATPEQYMFLPDYVMAAYAHATVMRNGSAVPAVKNTVRFHQADDYEQKKEKSSPTLIFAVIAAVIIFLTIRDFIKKKRTRLLDLGLMLFTGLLGALIVFLWFFTYHASAVNNLNILWAFAPNLFIAFFIFRRNPPGWVRAYVRFLFILLIIMASVWGSAFQIYNQALLPVMLMLAFRYGFLSYWGLVIKRNAKN